MNLPQRHDYWHKVAALVEASPKNKCYENNRQFKSTSLMLKLGGAVYLGIILALLHLLLALFLFLFFRKSSLWRETLALSFQREGFLIGCRCADSESLIQWRKILQKNLLFQHWQQLPSLQSNPKRRRWTFQKERLKERLTIHLSGERGLGQRGWSCRRKRCIFKWLFQKTAYPSFKWLTWASDEAY